MANEGMTIGEAYLQIRPSMRGMRDEIDEAMGAAGESGGATYGKSFGKGLALVGGLGVAAVGAASKEIADLTQSAVSSFADYQQLTGGVETLFGDDFQTVMDNADKAFATAGLSANEYMETAIQSAAAMITSLDGDTATASQLMDMSITDMADNVNKMGTSMEAVQNAYRGFSRGNFTMLDNLALGYAGTKEGMQQLLDKANELNEAQGIYTDYSIDSYSDIVEAIHVVQTEMGITGTTAEEADGTISGSVASIGAAWKNLVTGFANPDADLGKLIDNFVQTGTTALNNLMPTIVNALSGIAQALPQIANAIATQLPTILPVIIPPLIEAAITLINALVEALPIILESLIASLPMVIQTIVDTIITLLPMLIDLGLELILALAEGLIDALPELIPAIVDVILTIVDKLTDPDTIVQLVEAALQIMIALAEGLINALPKLIEKAPEIIKNLVEAIIKAAPQLLLAAAELILTLVEGIIKGLDSLIEKGAEIVDSVKEGFMNKVEGAKQWGKDMIQNFIDGILAKWNDLKDTVTDLAGTIESLLGFSEPKAGPLSDFHTYAPDMMHLFAEGITDNIGVVEGALDDMASAVKEDVTASANVNYSPAGEIATSSNDGLYGLLAEYLPMLADRGDVQVTLAGDADGLFRLMRNENQDYMRRTGQSAFV